ncbi:MAG TPA: M18 family aminopeptidase [Spirochaetales bacterium]|nr:M18 family aminopeptidase [Spirochaetales bacterium]HQG39431.1 M18 family aminopeptidase [Spirochaetales bacterium]HRV28620.1 M18 family aminopeptidase [Spirochaetia bacterium]
MSNPAIKNLCTFIDAAPTPYHTVDASIAMLSTAAAVKLEEHEPWKLEPGTLYYVTRKPAGLIAFRIGTERLSGFVVAGAHNDVPALKLRLEKKVIQRGMERLAVEVYGGPILATWLDRPLAIAGIVMLKTNQGVEQRLFNSVKPVAVIPNLAIHLNRDINKGFEYLAHQTLLPLVAESEGANNSWIVRYLARELDCSEADILASDLSLYDAEKAFLFGPDEEFLSSPRIDNLEGCHAVLEALCSARTGKQTQVSVLFNSEEIGSRTLEGADSFFLRDILERIILAQGGTREDFLRVLSLSFCVSVDGAQAWHPGFADKFDETYAPLLNKGPAIKLNANMRYTSDAENSARIVSLCKNEGIPCQLFRMRADLPSGTTIGPLTTSTLGVPGVDIGIPMLAMHSARELAGTKDHEQCIKLVKTVFEQGV